MKHAIYMRFLVYGISAIKVLSSCRDRNSKACEAIDSFAQLRSQFKEPSKEYGTIPFFCLEQQNKPSGYRHFYAGVQ